LHYANEKSNDVVNTCTCRSTKTVELCIKNISRKIRMMIVKLGTILWLLSKPVDQAYTEWHNLWYKALHIGFIDFNGGKL